MAGCIQDIEDFAAGFSPGDIIAVKEGPNPHRDGEEATTMIVFIDKAPHGGFYCFHEGGDERVYHSNMFVWGVRSAEVTGKYQPAFRQLSYGDVTWTETGIKEVDLHMMSLSKQYVVFNQFAPDWAKKRFEANEDKNYHGENRKFVASFLAFIGAGGEPKAFPKRYLSNSGTGEPPGDHR
jgi:hypothetical protein